jgi:glycosyltransferase involved in cell wall biosynthesis
MRRIAIVTPWYGADAVGGAETVARELAARLAGTCEVTILTTTSRAFLSDWEQPFYPEGVTRENGYAVARFAVDRRDRETFDAINAQLLALDPKEWDELGLRAPQTNAFIEDSINSRALEHYLRAEAIGRHDAVIFLPYLYGVIVRGIEAYPGSAHLLPCLHDEAYARLPRIEGIFHRAASLLMNSAGEAELALRLYGPGILQKMTVIGLGIEPTPAGGALPERVRPPYVLFVGRRDSTKNVDWLVESFRTYRANGSDRTLSLVLAGPGERSYDDPAGGVIDLGFIDAAAKRALVAAARGLIQPSINESYSRAVMEAWMERRPVAVHGACLATAMAVDACEGGFVARSDEEWSRVFAAFEGDDPKLAAMGERGEAYALRFAAWDRVIPHLLETVFGPETGPKRGKRIDQFVQTLEYGDAISDYALHVRHRLRRLGYTSDIFAEGIGPRVAGEAIFYYERSFSESSAVIYHHSIASAATKTVAALRVPKALVYHNITPPHFFERHAPGFAELLANGRAQTGPLLPRFDHLVADSEFNADELRALTTQPVRTIPVVVDFRRFDRLPDQRVVAARSRGTSVVFVGRVSPNKGIARLLDAFEAFLCLDPSAHLSIVGRFDPADRYYEHLQRTLLERRLEAAVTFTGVVDEAELTAYYRTADLFVSLSEHEGFCVPLVEAMFFEVPIVALGTTAIPETLGDAGLLVSPDATAEEIGALMHAVTSDPELRGRAIEAERRRRTYFLPEAGERRLDDLIAVLG